MDTKNICKIIVKNGGVLVRINFFIKKHQHVASTIRGQDVKKKCDVSCCDNT